MLMECCPFNDRNLLLDEEIEKFKPFNVNAVVPNEYHDWGYFSYSFLLYHHGKNQNNHCTPYSNIEGTSKGKL